MNSVIGLLAPVLAILPITAVPGGQPGMQDIRAMPAASLTVKNRLAGDGHFDGGRTGDQDLRRFREIVDGLRGQRAEQVRIEQRVIIRIAPAPASRIPLPDLRRGMPELRRNMFAETTGHSIAPQLEERRMAQCLPVSGIAGVRVSRSSKLVLYMRDQRIVSAALGKTCNPRDFYSGFYLERTADGMLCSGRDTLYSRSGANCELGKLRQLIEIGGDDD